MYKMQCIVEYTLFVTVNIFNVSYRVVTLSMSPIDDTFLSGSLDKSIRLWDLRSQNCQVRRHVLVIL